MDNSQNLIKALEQLNGEIARELLKPEHRTGAFLYALFSAAKRFKALRFFKILLKGISSMYRAKKVAGYNFAKPDKQDLPKLKPIVPPAPKIAVYTCNIGDYDNLMPPLYLPENCDYYVVSDEKSDFAGFDNFTYIDSSKYTQGLNGNLASRYIKMHPNVLFSEYEYSIFMDGNIRLISDPTPLIQTIGSQGIALHRHMIRCCLYDEAKVCLIYKRGQTDILRKQTADYEKQGMPRHFGLFEMGILLRKHNEKRCIELMGNWWDEFSNYPSRDQMSFPYILWKNGIKYDDIGILGNNLRLNPIFHLNELHKGQGFL